MQKLKLIGLREENDKIVFLTEKILKIKGDLLPNTKYVVIEFFKNNPLNPKIHTGYYYLETIKEDFGLFNKKPFVNVYENGSENYIQDRFQWSEQNKEGVFYFPVKKLEMDPNTGDEPIVLDIEQSKSNIDKQYVCDPVFKEELKKSFADFANKVQQYKKQYNHILYNRFFEISEQNGKAVIKLREEYLKGEK